MKIVDKFFLIKDGEFTQSQEFKDILFELETAILSVTWGSQTKFIINPKLRGNGVKPIKNNFISHLSNSAWESEKRLSLVRGVDTGPIDIIKKTNYGIFAVEWETGNISSSHRALNKIALGIIQGHIIGGFLVLPVRQLAKYLTDRIGNLEEITPYFELYQKIDIQNGVFGIISVTYDEVSEDVILIPKGKDGNADF